MDFNTYLSSILTVKEIKELKQAIRDNKTIIVKGKQEPTGKTTLVDILRSVGAKAVEPFDTHVITMDKPLPDIKEYFRQEVEV